MHRMTVVWMLNHLLFGLLQRQCFEIYNIAEIKEKTKE